MYYSSSYNIIYRTLFYRKPVFTFFQHIPYKYINILSKVIKKWRCEVTIPTKDSTETLYLLYDTYR